MLAVLVLMQLWCCSLLLQGQSGVRASSSVMARASAVKMILDAAIGRQVRCVHRHSCLQAANEGVKLCRDAGP